MTIITGTFDDSYNCDLLSYIRNLKNLSFESGPIIAGGSVRKILTKQFNSVLNEQDIDVFIKKSFMDSTLSGNTTLLKNYILNTIYQDNSPIIKKIYNSFLNINQCEILQSGDIINIKINPKYTYQFNSLNDYQTLEELFETFDYTICLCATDGYTWKADDRFFRDTRTHSLVINNKEKVNQHNIGRFLKYLSDYDFTPEPGLLNELIGINDEYFKSSVLYGYITNDTTTY